MAKAQLKTKPTGNSVAAFLNAIPDEARREDCETVLKLMKRATKAEPKMWGPGIVGFGSYHYKYDSGREGDFLVTGFSPRKQNLTLYLMGGFERHDALMRKLGKFKTAKSCLYIKRLADVDVKVLRELIEESTRHVARTYPVQS